MQKPHNRHPQNVRSAKQRTQLLAHRLRQARLAAGLSQMASAARLQRPQSYVSRCEAGLRRIDIFELQEFARVYQKSLTYFVETQSMMEKAEP